MLAHAHASRLHNAQRLDALDVGADDLGRVPQIDSTLRVDPELGRVPEQA